jgi:hypothetical protein
LDDGDVNPAITSLTVVSVVKDRVPDSACSERYAAVLEKFAIDFDLVLVANGTAAAESMALKALVASTPDTMAVYLAQPVHDDMARLVGGEHAVGDYVLFCELARDDPALLPDLLTPVQEGYDLVIADRGPERPGRTPLERVLVAIYVQLYRVFGGTPIALYPTGVRVLSRAAVLYVFGRADAELLLRARSIGDGFPAKLVPFPTGPAVTPRGVGHSWSKGAGLLISSNALPLRSASYAALLGGGLSVLYSLYIFFVYLFKTDVAAGWTTLSLQLAGMMFIFSVILLFLSEYVIQIHAASAPRNRRYLVVRELRSPLSRRTQRLNLVDADGRFQLGKPVWLAADEDRPER